MSIPLVFSQDININSTITTLSIDEKSFLVFDELGIGEWCSKVEDLTVIFRKGVSTELVTLTADLFPDLTRLGIAGPSDHLVSLDHVKPLCKKLMSSFPHLTGLHFTNVRLGNEKVLEIVKCLKHPDCFYNIT